MQGQRSAIDPIPENVDISLGSFPNNDIMTEQGYLSNRSNPDGNCFSNYMDSSDGAASTASGHGSGLGGWSLGQSSSLPSSECQLRCDEMKMELGWSPTRSICAGAGPSSAGRELEPHNAFFPGIPSGNQVASRHVGYVGSGGSMAQDYGPSVGYSADKSHASELDSRTSFGGASLRNSTGSSMQMEERTGGTSSSMATWGTSCKRKAFEGTSGSSQPSTSSGCAPEDDNFSWPNEPSSSNNNPPDIMNLSPPSWNSPRVNFLEQIGPSPAVGTREASNESFPPLSITGSAVNSRSISRGGNSGHPQEPVPYSLSPAGTGIGRHLNAFPLNHLQRPGPSGDSLDLRSRGVSANTNLSPTQLNSVHAPRLSRNVHAFPWSGASNSRNGNFLNSSFIPGGIDLGSRDEPNLRGIPRYSPDNLAVSPDSRNMAQDPTSWNIAAGSTSRASGLPSSSRAGPSSSSWSSNPSWASHRRVAPNRQRSVESAHWSLFPPVESESGGQSSHFTLPSSGNSTPQEHAVAAGSTSSQSHRQQFHRSAFSIDRGGDLVGMSESLRALAADFEGRHRILAEIRQVLNAVRRGENLRAEDYMFFEPIMFQSLAEMHDRHRDMRLDVDNMSYEELLALEERMGDVNTGLNEETILKHMKQQKKQISSRTEAMQDPEPCCVCQEEYVEEQDVGLLDCGHDFHVECIKQWLMHKNLCPICKTTGLVI